MSAKKKPKKRSGRTQSSEARRAAGRRLISVWVSAPVRELADDMATSRGETLSETVAAGLEALMRAELEGWDVLAGLGARGKR